MDTDQQAEAESLEVAVAQAIEACDGDLRATIPGVDRGERVSRGANLARLPALREARKVQHLFEMTVTCDGGTIVLWAA
jgi:hypothetical protein